MNCKVYRALYADYLDDELCFDVRQNFELHLKSCQECAKDFQETRNNVRLCQGLPLLEPPKSLLPKIFDELKLYLRK